MSILGAQKSARVTNYQPLKLAIQLEKRNIKQNARIKLKYYLETASFVEPRARRTSSDYKTQSESL